MRRNPLFVGALVLVLSCTVTGAAGNRSAMRSAPAGGREQSVSYEYDSLHRLAGVTYASGTQIVYEYDAVGNRTSRLVIFAR